MRPGRPCRKTLAIYSSERPSPGIEGSHAESTRSFTAARRSAQEKTYAQPTRQLPPRWEPAVSPHRHLARSSSCTSSPPRLRTTSCRGGPYATTGSLPFVPPPVAQPARPALSCAHAGCPVGETPTAATTLAAGERLAGAAPETPRRAESCAPTPGWRQRTWGGRRSPSSCVRLAPPASLTGWFAPPARLVASRSGRARAQGSAARWQGWPASPDVLEVARGVLTDTF